MTIHISRGIILGLRQFSVQIVETVMTRILLRIGFCPISCRIRDNYNNTAEAKVIVDEINIM
jgi:hypothetical protein